jgi:hypothetical protein
MITCAINKKTNRCVKTKQSPNDNKLSKECVLNEKTNRCVKAKKHQPIDNGKTQLKHHIQAMLKTLNVQMRPDCIQYLSTRYIRLIHNIASSSNKTINVNHVVSWLLKRVSVHKDVSNCIHLSKELYKHIDIDDDIQIPVSVIQNIMQASLKKAVRIQPDVYVFVAMFIECFNNTIVTLAVQEKPPRIKRITMMHMLAAIENNHMAQMMAALY